MAWEFGSGNRTNYDFYITDAYFAPDATYNNGEDILLQLIGHDENEEDVKEIYSVGKNWISTDGGKTIESQTSANAKINQSSMYARFCQAAIALGVGEMLEKRGNVNEAKVWNGLVFHMDEVLQNFGKNIESKYRNMPVAFKGLVGEITPSTAPITPIQSAADKIAAARASAPSTNGDLTPQLVSLAKSSPDFNEFVNQAVELPGITEDDELLTFTVDPTDTGFYALNK